MPSNVLPSGPMRWATTANKAIPVFASSGSANMPVQSAIWASRPFYWFTNAATAGSVIGPNAGALTTAGTFAFQAISGTNLYTQQARGTYATVITTANQQVGIRSGSNLWMRTNGSAGIGGFLFVCRFGIEAWTAGDRLFVGMAAAPGNGVVGQPSALINCLGFGVDASDTAITFIHNDGSGTATKTAIAGTTLAANQGYDAYIFCKPNDSTVYYRLDDVNAGTTLVDTSTATDLPANNTSIGFDAVIGNAANTGAGAASIGVSSLYIESDR